MIVPYFPAVLADELLYSVLARRHRHLGTPGPSITMLSLFGRRSGIACYDLPGHLSAVAARIDPVRGLTADRLVDRTTLFPYYAAFMEPRVAIALRAAMHEGAKDFHLAVGIAAFRVPRHRSLRFCPDCKEAMEREHGEAYWRRFHQLPGVLVCPRHRRSLHESVILLDGANRHRFIAADGDSCPPNSPAIVASVGSDAMQRLVDIATASEDLLEVAGPAREAALSVTYRARLASTGLMRSPAKVDQASLDVELTRYYGDALAHLPGILRDGSCSDWLPGLLRSKKQAHHPLCHLLLDGFLLSRPTFPSPFGKGPWACRNPLEEHVGEATIAKMRIHRNRDTTVGTFACGCGYAYTRCVFRNGRLGPPRLREYGPTLAPALHRLIVPGAGLRAVARQVGLDPKTLIREAASLGLPTPWSCRASGRARLPSTAPNMSVRTSGPSKPRPPQGPRKKWDVIDLRSVAEVRTHASAILSLEPAVRVTVAGLESRMGRCGWLRKRRELLPLSNAAADDAAEELDVFQRRRTLTVIRQLREAGLYPTPWEVMRAAGLRGRNLPMIRAAMSQPARLKDGPLIAAPSRGD